VASLRTSVSGLLLYPRALAFQWSSYFADSLTIFDPYLLWLSIAAVFLLLVGLTVLSLCGVLRLPDVFTDVLTRLFLALVCIAAGRTSAQALT